MRHGFRGRTMTMTMMIAVTALLASGCGSDNGTAVPVAASIVLTPSSTGNIVSIGDTRTVTAVVKDAAGATLSGAAVTWTSSDAAVATVAGSGNTATVTSTGNGTATIKATSGTATTNVSVTVAQVFASVGLTAASPSIAIGATSALTASARDAKGAAIAGTTGFTFSTGAATVAIVSATGVVTGIAPGSATITSSLTKDGVTSTGTAAVTVVAPASAPTAASIATTGLLFTPASATIAVGGAATWAIAGTPHNVTFSTANAPANVATTSNASVSRTFATAGTFAYVCTLHAGMTGSILVQAPSFFSGAINGANERPTPNALTGNGAAVFTVNGTTVSYTVTFQGISSAPTGLHIHAPSGANANAGVIVDLLTTPQPATSGVLTGTFTASAIRNAAVSLDSLFVLMRNGNAYVNIHTTANPGGEIRGTITTP